MYEDFYIFVHIIHNALEVTGNTRTWQVYKNVHCLQSKGEQVRN
jgi:hypothetical protein